jgi:molecular chaperone IbpA
MTSTGLTLGRIDFAPLNRFTVGLDDMFNDLARLTSHTHQESNYPPYNIIKYNEDSYAIEVAIAGFDQSEIDVNIENNHLTISGNRTERSGIDSNYVHRGISARNFVKTFTLGNYIEVNGATIKNGMLTVSLTRVVPDALKPRKISITNVEK